MKSTFRDIIFNKKCLQGSKIFRTFKYFLAQHSTAQHSTAQHSTAQHSLKQLIFLLLLFCGLFSFAQEENNASFYVDPSTTIVGVDFISFDSIKKQDKQINQSALYVVNNTILFTAQDLVIITIESTSEHILNKEKCCSKKEITEVINNRTNTSKPDNIYELSQTPFKNSVPFDKNQITVLAISSVTTSSTSFSKIYFNLSTKVFELIFDINLSQKGNLVTTFCNYILFQIRVKYCNRPPPSIC